MSCIRSSASPAFRIGKAGRRDERRGASHPPGPLRAYSRLDATVEMARNGRLRAEGLLEGASPKRLPIVQKGPSARGLSTRAVRAVIVGVRGQATTMAQPSPGYRMRSARVRRRMTANPNPVGTPRSKPASEIRSSRKGGTDLCERGARRARSRHSLTVRAGNRGSARRSVAARRPTT